MARYCGNCGTEVDDTAVFCPTCGQPIEEGEVAEMPAAPAWPDPTFPDARPAEDEDRHVVDDGEPAAAERRGPEPAAYRPAPPEPADDAPTRVEARPPSPDRGEREPAAARPADAPRPSPHSPGNAEPARTGAGGAGIDLPITTPVTLTGWLIGVGSVLAVIGLLVILIVAVFNVIDLLLLLGLVGIAATVWFSDRLPAMPNVRLITLVVTLIAFGVALDRIALGRGGAGDLLLFLGSAAAAMGAILLELGQDQPLGGPQR